jgi:RhoGEF domain.
MKTSTAHFMRWLRLLSGTVGPHQKKLQEAKFEIISSEASYINSLNVLEKHFMSSLEMCDDSVLCKNDRRILFSNLIPGNLTHCIALH